MSLRQLPLSMPPRDGFEAQAFVLGAPNRAAHAMVMDPARWPHGRLALTGPEGAGKSHLVAVLAAAVAGARIVSVAAVTPAAAPGLAGAALAVVEDVQALGTLEPARGHPGGRRAAEDGLFHLINLVAAGQGRLLLTGRGAPSRWPTATPDLASRLAATTAVEIGAPDDAFLSLVMLKAAADRGLDLDPAALALLVQRAERSYAGARAAVDAVDAAATGRRRRRVGARLAAAALREAGIAGAGDDRAPGESPRG
ncbi:MAG: hypothetical protein AAF677_06135 [Pseudomonadota bacterium]